jgi:hypothetical protein
MLLQPAGLSSYKFISEAYGTQYYLNYGAITPKNQSRSVPNVLNRHIYYFSEGKFLARVIRGPTAESKASDQSGLEEKGTE